ncbi:long-chain fatty acid transport protein [Acinetobacter marinus]|uniref:Long-chain fatty acid transport protein n=1 Tax=Acinetobacter marinus TaxID=281375 RepID=A0A1G6KRG3_9GAMM|nr:outer membrane protein transport protein [Acinetobacter marinus]SDC33679.1 long-chain fatty acid transport protein [Acinetobacter marinus]
MKIKTLTAALACALPVTGAFAAALDRSGQSMSAFLQPGNYAEVGMSILDPEVSGKEAGEAAATGRDVNDIADDYHFYNFAIKMQPTEHFSFGLLYDQPFGAKASFSGDNVFVANSADTVLGLLPTSAIGGTEGGTEVEVESHNLSAVFGFQPNENWNIYAGPVYQTVKGDVKLRGNAFSLYNGYDADIDETEGWGWLAGVAFQIPEIALKISATYRSEIDHDANIAENIAVLDGLTANPALLGALAGAPPVISNRVALALAANGESGKTTITTPQSVNLDLQTGIMANTVAFAQIRWVDWSNFSLQPVKFGAVSEAVGPLVGKPNGFNLVEYSDDQISVNAGVGRKFNDQWSGSLSVGWDSGAGEFVSVLGPTEGYWNVGLGAQFSPAPNYFVQAGVKYFWLGDAKGQTGSQAGTEDYWGEFEDNNAIAYGLKLGYRF